MKKTIALLFVLLVIWEVAVYLFSVSISDLGTIKYQLAARYSARTSFFLIAILAAWVGILGLYEVYSDEKHRKIFIALISMFAINHLIHFGFIVLNVNANDLSLMEPRNVIGALGYVLLSVAPVYLWSKKLNRALYWQIHLFLLFIIIIFFVTYLGRLGKPIPLRTPLVYYGVCLALIMILVVLNGYRIVKERKLGKQKLLSRKRLRSA